MNFIDHFAILPSFSNLGTETSFELSATPLVPRSARTTWLCRYLYCVISHPCAAAALVVFSPVTENAHGGRQLTAGQTAVEPQTTHGRARQGQAGPGLPSQGQDQELPYQLIVILPGISVAGVPSCPPAIDIVCSLHNSRATIKCLIPVTTRTHSLRPQPKIQTKLFNNLFSGRYFSTNRSSMD